MTETRTPLLDKILAQLENVNGKEHTASEIIDFVKVGMGKIKETCDKMNITSQAAHQICDAMIKDLRTGFGELGYKFHVRTVAESKPGVPSPAIGQILAEVSLGKNHQYSLKFCENHVDASAFYVFVE